MQRFSSLLCLAALGSFTVVSAGHGVVAGELRAVELSCSSLGRIRVREAAPNASIRQPLSDFLILTLPTGSEVKLISSHGANVRNWTSPSAGITFSQAPTWSKERVTFARDSYGYKKGAYYCSSKW